MQIGRRGKIIYAIKQRLENIKTREDGGAKRERQSWTAEDEFDDYYPISVRSVLLDPEDPIALDRDNLLPCIILQYADGRREYESSRSTYSTMNEIEERMMVTARVILRPIGMSIDGEDIPMTVVAANIHESIDEALGIGYGLSLKIKPNGMPDSREGTPEVIEGVKTIKIMSWKVPYDLWQIEYMVIDFPIMVCHVFPRGKGV